MRKFTAFNRIKHVLAVFALSGATLFICSLSAPAERIRNPIAVFSGLDKITGRTTIFNIRINETYQFGSLQITPRICYTNPADEAVKTDSFVEVNEITLDQKIKRIFTGWMFADSPGLNAVDHPIYDAWLINCKQK
ncbi:MAG: DUF2155 domain-containing protein [Candidatus Tokpelaia sp.]|nr:MAG: DUF2155 domain-containing protein [Candidatus Tokpelaia sp.]KAA6207544.1 MAG: DUF2155 domain-containing protein [Candidatus Tokpelaia sp.]KAA6404714.1 DUF2155 domain-containing protein [Candidatus Tokpelaia sp.]